MAGKHQIWSSNKKTRQKARRCWPHKERLRDESLSEEHEAASGSPAAEALKAGPLVHATDPDIGTPLGPLIDRARREGRKLKVRDFAAMVRKWNDCTPQDFAGLMSHLPADQLDEHYHRFHAMPLEYFLALDLDTQARFVQWLEHR